MFQKLAIGVLLGLAAAASPAGAETFETFLNSSGSGDSFASTISFYYSCGEECHAADLACGNAEPVEFSLTGFESKQAAAMITNAKPRFAIKVGVESFDFYVRRVNYEGEMTGDWTVDGWKSGTGEDFLVALAKAKSFKATVGSKSITLPVNADVLAWTKVCPK